jgi:AcrR family transcriptional regulator
MGVDETRYRSIIGHMSRPRTVTDVEVFEALRAVVAEVGPAAWTLRQVSTRVGLSAPTLVQRFGTKRGLLAAFLTDEADRVPEAFLGPKSHPDPLAKLEQALLVAVDDVEGDIRAAARLGALRQMAAADPEMRGFVRRAARLRRKGIRKWLKRATKKRQLRRSTRTRALARAVEVAVEGALVTGALHSPGSLRRWVRRSIRRTVKPARKG